MKLDVLFFKSLCNELEKKNIKYAINRKAEQINSGNFNDIDWTVDYRKIDEFYDILSDLCVKYDWKIFMNIKKQGFETIHLFNYSNNRVLLLHFDLFNSFMWDGIELINNEELLQNIVKIDGYNSISPVLEAIIKLLTRLLFNGYIKEEYKQDILNVFKNRENEIKIILKKIIGCNLIEELYEDVLHEEWSKIEKSVNDYKTEIRKNVKSRDYIKYTKNRIRFKFYKVNRIFKKKGIMVVFEGSDGSGKTTIIDALPKILYRSFDKSYIDYYHWRPKFIKSPKRDSKNEEGYKCPHQHKPYNKVISVGKFLFFNLDYILGYWCKVRIQLAKGRLVIFDRYYYDYYLDKIRYRLDIDDNLINLFKVFIPKPDVTYLLIGDPYILYERKKEIPVEEIKTQLNKINKNKNKFNNPIIIDVNEDIETVSNKVSYYILEECSKKLT